jgi:hypothetical protein
MLDEGTCDYPSIEETSTTWSGVLLAATCGRPRARVFRST